MIVTCASCLTKFSLDETKIPSQGAKVRCSRCHHVFHIVPPVRREEEDVVEDFESFAKSHQEVMEPPPKKEPPPPAAPKRAEKSLPMEEERVVIEEEDLGLLDKESGMAEKEMAISEKDLGIGERGLEMDEEAPSPSLKLGEEELAAFADRESARPAPSSGQRAAWDDEAMERRPFRSERVGRRKKKGPLLFLPLLIVLLVLVVIGFFIWTSLQSSGKLSRYAEAPVRKVTTFWKQLWSKETKGLVFQDLNGYEEKVGEVSLYIIEGKVTNQSGNAKKHIKVKVVILDQQKMEIAEKEVLCGLVLSQDEIKALPPAFFQEEIVIKPQSEKEMMVPSGQTISFMVIFKNLSGQPREFQPEIVEAPNLP